MTLTSTYRSFLASPSAASLASNAAINYIPTLVTVNGPDAIEKHFAREQKFLKRKSEDVLHAIESDNALCLELDTTIEFTDGGASYLPGLDDNFLSGHTVRLPIVHIVQFSEDLKIQQVRIFWDQGSLLKSVDVIGARGKNWPINDGTEHIRAIKKSSTAAPVSANTPIKASFPSRSRSVVNAINDPKASLELFAPRDVDADDQPGETVRAPRGDARPPPREYGELFAAAQDDPRERSESPSKSRNRAKTGAGSNYHAPRLFSQGEEKPLESSPQKPVVGKRYEHFEISDGHDQPPEEPAKPRARTKHQSQWDFEDFVTPARPSSRVRPQEQRAFSFEDDEDGSPTQRNKAATQAGRARRDAEKHFDLLDDGTSAHNRPRGHPRGFGSMNMDAGLYKNNLYDDNGMAGTPRNEKGITNVKDRSKDFDAHWQVAEGTPQASRDAGNDRRAALQRPITTTVDNNSRKKDFDSQFSMEDEPTLGEQSASDRNRTAGSGNVGRRGAPQANWSLGGDGEPESVKKIYRTAGNGMGSRTGARGWGIGDEE